MARFPARIALRWSDMDAFGHVNNVVFLTYLEEARVEMIYAMAVEQAEATGQRPQSLLEGGVVVAHSEIDYRRPLVHRYEPVPIDIWVSRIGGASFDLSYEVHDEGGVVYATAMTTIVTYDFQAAAPRRIRPHERTFLERYHEPADTARTARSGQRADATPAATPASAAAPTP